LSLWFGIHYSRKFVRLQALWTSFSLEEYNKNTECMWPRMSVSVVMPAKNAAAHIAEAIESVLRQGPLVGELIIIDDGSVDGTPSIVRAFKDERIELMVADSRGVSAARNAGARAASGDWLMFLDADDRLRPNAIAELLKGAAAAPVARVIYGDYDRIDEIGRPIGSRGHLTGRRKPSGRILEKLVAGNFIVNGGIMIIRSAAFAAAGGFDESLKYCEDWHCWCRLAAIEGFHYVPHILLDYRVHDASTMSATIRTPDDFMPAVQRVFSDRAILEKLAKRTVPKLREAAEVHVASYAAAQAVRSGSYRKALEYGLRAIRRSPLAAPWVTLQIGSAFLGI
jgi:glycosyltransferase involved in cell wall biosynthesis